MGTVLIIDDDKHFCLMLAEHIQRVGHGVSIAHSRTEGIKKAEQSTFDVLFLDIRLPDGSGLESLPLLQQLQDAPDCF